MRALIFVVVFAGIAAVVGYKLWSTFGGIKGDGVVQTEHREVADFAGIEITGGYEIQWSQDKPALTISTDENLLPHIRTRVSDHTLYVDSDQNLRPSKNTVVTVSSRSLAKVELTGANDFKAGAMAGADLKVVATGASKINLAGSMTNLVVDLTGASTLHAQSLQTQMASLSLTGASRADVSVAESLKASITGAGSVTYSGNPKSVEQNIAGAGSIRHRP